MGVTSGPKIPTRGSEFNVFGQAGELDSTTGWAATNTLGSSNSWGISGGVASINGTQSSTTHLYRSISPFIENSYYKITLTITAYTAGTLNISFHTGSATSGTNMTAVGTYSFVGQCTGNNAIYIGADASFNGSIDNLSAVKVDSNGNYISPLLLSLDAMNAKSFAGEPTSNLCTSRISDGAIAFSADGTNSPLSLTATSDTTETPFGNTAYKLTFAAGGSHGTGYAAERATTSSWTVDRAKTYSYGIWIAFNNDYCKYRFEVAGTIYGYITGSNGMANFHGQGAATVYIDAGGKRWYHYGRKAQTIGSSGSASEFWTFFRNGATYTEECTLWVCGPQFEEGSSFTPFTSTSRSVTNAWKDLSGRGNHGTFSAEDFGDAGDVGLYKKGQILLPTGTDNIVSSPAAIHFDATDDQVTVTHNSDFTAAKTWALWFKLDSIPGSGAYKSIIYSTDDWNSPGGISLQMIYGNFKFSWGTTWNSNCAIANSELSTGVWYHFVGTSIGDTTSDGIKMYLNGELRDTGTATQVPDDTPTNVKIGGGSGGTMDGKIATFQVYGTELSHEQVKSMYNSQKSRFGH